MKRSVNHLVLGLLLAASNVALAADISWTKPVGADVWSNSTNWNLNRIPEPSDNVFLTNNGTYTVTLDIDAIVNRLTVGGQSGTAPIFSAAHTLTLSNGGIINTNGRLVLQNGTIEVSSGELKIDGNSYTDGGNFILGFNALVRLTGTAFWSGQMTGSGSGTILFEQGQFKFYSSGLTLNFSSNLFLWTGGVLEGPVTNVGGITIFATNSPILNNILYNSGLIQHANGGGLLYAGGSSIVNLPGSIYDFRGDGGTLNVPFWNYGTLRKSSGTGTTTLPSWSNQGGTIQGESGNLILNGGNHASGNFVIAASALVELTGNSDPSSWSGEITGNGSGRVQLSKGTLNASALKLNLSSNLFWWTGGQFSGISTNLNVVTLWATNFPTIGGAFNNAGLFRHTNSGTLQTFGYFVNLPIGTYDFQGDGVVNGTLTNYGTLRKSSGIGISTVSGLFNQEGIIEATTGKLILTSGGTSKGGTFLVTEGASVELYQGGWSGQITGSGLGIVQLNRGVIFSQGLTLNFPSNVFRWTGGAFYGPTTNVGTLTLWPTNGPNLYNNFYNAGLIKHTNSGSLTSAGGSGLVNLTNGTYDFQGDGSVTVPFTNYGIVRKSSGAGSATISSLVNQGGAIEVNVGGLMLNSAYSQNGGALTVSLAGNGTGQFGRVIVNGNASLSGPLNVNLLNGFVPAFGSQFEILTSSSRSGNFSVTNVPAGFSINYSNNSVFLIVVPPAPVQILSPSLFNGVFNFSFQTVSNRSYTIQQNTNLASTNWVYYTNLTGDGAIFQFATPATNDFRFFRVRQP